MGPRIYPLAPAVWGAGLELPVEHVVQASLFSEFAHLRGTAYMDVALQPDPLHGTWRVRRILIDGTQGPILGTITAPVREQYSEMKRIEASLLMPTTVAEVRLDSTTGQFDVRVILPPPPLAVPRNDTPDGALVLPPGDMIVVDTAKGEYTAEELAARSPGTWLVALHLIGDSVAATLGDRVLGGFDPDENAVLTGYVRDVADEIAPGSKLFARAILLDGMAALNAGAPDEGAQALPALALPDMRPTTPWTVIDFPDGTWGITVERDFAVDPEDTVKPKHTARYVSLSGAGRPEGIEPPTEMFGAVATVPDPGLPEPAALEPAPAAPELPAPAAAPQAAWAGAGDYLTEVQKVAVRRAARVNQDGVGRHRK